MIDDIIKAIFGDPDKKKIKYYSSIVEQFHKKEEEFANFSLEDIQNKTAEFKQKFVGLDFKNPEDSLKIKELLKEILIEAFANLKQATKLINGKEFELASGKKIVWNMIPYDVQLIGGIAIHYGQIAEMKTGEGKTLVATLPAYLNTLTGNPVHIVTVNDYLANRDSQEMGILYKTLGLTVGVITHNQNNSQKFENYHCDIVYATNNEMGFDYLRDNMVIRNEDKVMSSTFFAIIDEVDSILIDEARTPLIISMPDNEPTSKYMQFAILSKELIEGQDYKIDEKQKTATLTESGITKIEKVLGVENIYISEHYNDLHHIENALKARAVYKKDIDYLVDRNGEILIIDEHTGRTLAGRRYSEGLHQAIEAKEGVEIKRESKTLASITFQNYFRMYWKLSGMTGTAKTEEEEFYKVYALETLVIPTNKPIAREDRADLLFKNEKGKFDYTIKLIKELHKKGQPILVGTISVAKSEYLSDRLKAENIPHNVLNAKQHEREAEVIAQAGQYGAVTIATNMAGRGTDIKLGEGVIETGGLVILGTEKHETRRIDNQLRGRAGRQGDPGMTQFLISPQDEIMRIFGGDKLFGVFNSPMFASLPDDEPLAQSGMLTSRVTSVQKQVEGYNFDSRKHVLEYDDVMNKHREIIYGKRNKILDSENIDIDVKHMIKHQVEKLVSALVEKNTSKENIIKNINEFLGVELLTNLELEEKNAWGEYIGNLAIEEIDKLKSNFKSEEEFYDIERKVVLQSIDDLWMRHIDSMSKLRETVAFEGYAQRNPLIVYKEKAFEKFAELIGEIEYKTTKSIFSVKANIEIKQMELNENNFVVINDEESLNITQKTNSNPLFVNPSQNINNSTSNNLERKKIRV
ncbi:MAG: preprotein translocase subunit SecA [Candidatus Gracilibacteria bacterium]|nr:preprotein translocase subunit SecA [Candidatus Gracilibacteria bacterium]